ncbi:MAG: PEP/pyruvate-binding domain-containing protein [Desulfobulbaceae bacterium]|nr:PEP/pyruvate-binding domain-containing protein [Desulfobulbaceae bacterium]
MEFLKRCRKLFPSWLFAGWGGKPVNAREVFERFQRVLASNNRAMEIIADMGEKLSGAFIFDRQYVVSGTESLTTAVGDSILALEQLTATSFPALSAIHQRLAEQLHSVVTGSERCTGPQLIKINEASLADVAVVGGKCAHLAELIRLGFLDVPSGFVITTRSFHDLIDANGLRASLDTFEHLLADTTTPLTTLVPIARELTSGIMNATPPPELLAGIQKQIDDVVGLPGARFAVRSSALEEDMDFSFAGQFVTILNVLAQPEAIFSAYREVAASLFDEPAISYRRQLFPGEGRMTIAAGCQVMIDSQVSGLLFSIDTADVENESMVIVGAWGQGDAIVEGTVATDSFQLRREPLEIIERRVVAKPTGRYLGNDIGTEERQISLDLTSQPCLNDEQILLLAAQALRIEQAFRRPQDIEWALDPAGNIFILQARPLFIPETAGNKQAFADAVAHLDPLLTGGRIASLGVAAGLAHRVLTPEDLNDFPEGAVLVARRDSAIFSKVLSRAAAIVTEVGTPLSHMSTLCREMRVPCLVNVPQLLDKVADGDEITVDAENGDIYSGRIKELINIRINEGMDVNASIEFRLLRRVVRDTSMLHLVDPLLGQFRAEACQSYHDILRFTHETAVQTLVDMGRDEQKLLGGHLARRLNLPIPTGILVIDLGGGLAQDAPANDVTFKDVTSLPFKAILRGMLYPEVWHNAPMAVGFRDMMHSMFNPAHDVVNKQYTGHNIAIIGKNYVNLCFRLGYHFNIIDAHCDTVEQNNHLYFRFLGGVTDLTKRSRRSLMIATILRAFEFSVQTRGDIVTARLSHLPVAEVERTLDILGRLVGFTRQLDVRMENDQRAEEYAEAFLNGDYGIVSR